MLKANEKRKENGIVGKNICLKQYEYFLSYICTLYDLQVKIAIKKETFPESQ